MNGKILAGFLLACALCVLPAALLADNRDLEKQLQAEYAGKTLTLRHFYHGDHLRFRPDGSVYGDPAIGSWTVDGRLSVEKVELRDGVLDISARRIYIVFDRGSKPVDDLATIDSIEGKARKEIEKTLRNLKVKVEIELPPTSPSEQDVSAGMKAVFMASGESMLGVVPAYWRMYFAGLENQPPEKPDPNVYFVRPGGEISAPKPLLTPDPEYSQAARTVKYQGVMVLSIVAAPDGTAQDVQIEKPLGVELDEKAVAVVSTWKFEPARKDGVPVPVRLKVEVQFRLY